MRARGGQQRNEVREIVLEYGTLHRALRLDFLLEYGKGPLKDGRMIFTVGLN